MWLINLYLSEERSHKVTEAAANPARRLSRPSADPDLLSIPRICLR
jgi:hypothetical protein